MPPHRCLLGQEGQPQREDTMKKLVQHHDSRATGQRRAPLSIAALALAATVAAAAGIAAAQGNAAPPNPKPPQSADHIKKPKLTDGVLTVRGSDHDDTIVLRLKTGDPSI